MQQQEKVLSGRMPAPTDCPLDRGVIGGVDDDDEQVTPREPGVGKPPESFAVTDQLVFDLGAVLVDQVDERIDSPNVASIDCCNAAICSACSSNDSASQASRNPSTPSNASSTIV